MKGYWYIYRCDEGDVWDGSKWVDEDAKRYERYNDAASVLRSIGRREPSPLQLKFMHEED